MKKFNVLRIIILLLILIFGFKFISEIFFVKGGNEKNLNTSFYFKISSIIFPVSSETHFRYGHSILTDFERSKEKSLLENSIRSFNTSLTLNPLNYNAHIFLGKALMMSESPDPSVFERAVISFKRASSIRPGDINVSVDTIKILLSLWPFLDKPDKDYCSELMQRSMQRIDQKRFLEILEAWGFYSKDPLFSNSFFNKNGRYYSEIVKEFAKHELDIRSRWKFLSRIEEDLLTRHEKKYNEIGKIDKKNIKKFKSFYNSLNRNIKGYYKFVKNNKFKESKFKYLKKNISIRIIEELLKEEITDRNLKEINNYIGLYIKDFNSLSEIDEIMEILDRKKYFDTNNLEVFFLKQNINYRSGNISLLISETEKFKNSVTYIANKHSADYAKILTTLADAYIESRLITRALDILKEIEKINPGLLSTYWQLYRIEKIIGEDDSLKENKEKNFRIIEGSNKITITSNTTKKSVYLSEITNISIFIDTKPENKLSDYHILKVFVNKNIFHEEYKENLKLPLELILPINLKNSKVDVVIKLSKY